MISTLVETNMATSYSEKELSDIAYVKNLCGVTTEQHEEICSLLRPDAPNATFTHSFSLTAPAKCSDGKRRTPLDYIDFLFSSPTIEELVAKSNTPDRVFTVTVDVNVINSTINATFTRRV